MEFSEFSVEKMLASSSKHAICSFTLAIILHTLMFTILIMVVSETVHVVSHCVQVCLSYFFCFSRFLLFHGFFFVALVDNKGTGRPICLGMFRY